MQLSGAGSGPSSLQIQRELQRGFQRPRGNHYVTARMDGFLPPSSAYPLGRWVALSADRTAVGVWSNGVCRNRVDLPAQQGLTPYSKVRIAARAVTNSGGDLRIQFPAKVSVGFRLSGTGGY